MDPAGQAGAVARKPARVDPIERDLLGWPMHTATDSDGHEVVRNRPRGRSVVTGLLVVALAGSLVALWRSSPERTRQEQRAEQAELDRAQALERLDEFGSPTGFPGIDPAATVVISLDTQPGVHASLAVLIEQSPVVRVWLVAEIADAPWVGDYGLLGGSCAPDWPPPVDWVVGPASTGGAVRLQAGPLTVDPSDADVWVRLHHGDGDLGGVRGPLAAPRLLSPGDTAC